MFHREIVTVTGTVVRVSVTVSGQESVGSGVFSDHLQRGSLKWARHVTTRSCEKSM